MSSRAKPTYKDRGVKSVDEFLADKISMLGENPLPREYGNIESAFDAADRAFKTKGIRVHIIWDNGVDDFPLGEVLDKMRETGAAMVVKAEAVS